MEANQTATTVTGVYTNKTLQRMASRYGHLSQQAVCRNLADGLVHLISHAQHCIVHIGGSLHLNLKREIPERISDIVSSHFRPNAFPQLKFLSPSLGFTEKRLAIIRRCSYKFRFFIFIYF